MDTSGPRFLHLQFREQEKWGRNILGVRILETLLCNIFSLKSLDKQDFDKANINRITNAEMKLLLLDKEL